MPQLDPSTYPSQLFWLFVTFLLLYLVLWRVVLPQVSAVRTARQAKIDTDLDRAEQLKQEAETVRAGYEKTLAEATGEAQGIHRQTALALTEERQARQSALAADLSRDTAAAEQRIAGEKQAALSEMSEMATDLVQASVERLIGARVDAADADAAIRSVERTA